MAATNRLGSCRGKQSAQPCKLRSSVGDVYSTHILTGIVFFVRMKIPLGQVTGVGNITLVFNKGI